MKRALICLPLVGLISACNPTGNPPEAYQHSRDRMIVRFGLTAFGYWPCDKDVETPYGKVQGSSPTDQCYRMTEPARWRGLWRNEFEGSRFCPAPAKRCVHETPGDKIWLTALAKSGASETEEFGGLYAMDFIGRRTTVKGSHGHLGGSEYELIVDRVISMKQVEPAPPPPTEAELKAKGYM